MGKSIGRMAALIIFASALGALSCGADPGVQAELARALTDAETRPEPARFETNRVIRLNCGDLYSEITRAEGFGDDESEAREECEDRIRERRPSVSCPGCRHRGACVRAIRRSNIITHCERDGRSWDCRCGQRTVLGCTPCWEIDAAGGGQAESCGGRE